jgi:hypothetical protein
VNAHLRKWLTGIGVRQEYLCLALEKVSGAFSVRLTTRQDESSIEVTGSHLFLGYSPLIMAVPFAAEDGAASADEICLSFDAGQFAVDERWRGFAASRASVARLHLKRIAERRMGDTRLVFYAAVFGWHRMLGAFHRVMNDWLQRLKKKPAGNVALHGNLYEQVRIAYSVPRIISLVSVRDTDMGTGLMNLFPTDLHGPVGDSHYVSSLRVGGRACEQVEAARRLVISEVDAAAFQAVYRLGKNHMKPLADPATFDLHAQASATFGIPLPAAVVRYRELEWHDFFDWGIHRLFCYRVVHHEKVTDSARLAHVHNCYAQWRANVGLRTEYLLR